MHGKQAVDAKLHDLTGVLDVKVTTWRCCRKSCRAVFGPNFVWQEGKKVNTASAQDFEENKSVFISTNRGFPVRYLKFYANLNYRCFTSSTGVAWVQKETFGNKNEETGYGGDYCELHRQLHADALMYYLSVQEFSCVRQRLAVVIGEEISEETLEKHDS